MRKSRNNRSFTNIDLDLQKFFKVQYIKKASKENVRQKRRNILR